MSDQTVEYPSLRLQQNEEQDSLKSLPLVPSYQPSFTLQQQKPQL